MNAKATAKILAASIAGNLQDPDFVAAERELEPGYQVARLRIQRGLTHTCPGRWIAGTLMVYRKIVVRSFS
jgi:hypothetical protein